ncbi:hypothetical protein C4D60_Mb04t02790 [Musa balbisiana]|uniref:Uncharacterized protein n=1 Tax=Musa balbisiana TaxID=52838 RepID=A0A4S8K966_MUSBA|nr:hypothetical protein C4D60_Mb04t02790 [Musa balbisiana]
MRPTAFEETSKISSTDVVVPSDQNPSFLRSDQDLCSDYDCSGSVDSLYTRQQSTNLLRLTAAQHSHQRLWSIDLPASS